MRKLDLSEREDQVLQAAAQGLTDKEISQKLGISAGTIKSYWLRIRQKTGGFNRTEAVATVLAGNATASTLKHESLVINLAKHMAIEAGVDGYVVDDEGNIVYSITSSSDINQDLVQGNLSSLLKLSEEEQVKETIKAVTEDLMRRTVSSEGSFQGMRSTFRIDVRPNFLREGETGAYVVVTRPKVATEKD